MTLISVGMRHTDVMLLSLRLVSTATLANISPDWVSHQERLPGFFFPPALSVHTHAQTHTHNAEKYMIPVHKNDQGAATGEYGGEERSHHVMIVG